MNELDRIAVELYCGYGCIDSQEMARRAAERVLYDGMDEFEAVNMTVLEWA